MNSELDQLHSLMGHMQDLAQEVRRTSAELKQEIQKLEEQVNTHMAVSSILLDEYEAVNLLSALRASGCYQAMPAPNPLCVLNSGDWIGQIIQKIEKRLSLAHNQDPDSIHCPNLRSEQYVQSAAKYMDYKNADQRGN